jgi:PhnB protein
LQDPARVIVAEEESEIMTPRPLTLVPPGHHTVTPWIIVKGAAQMVAFIERVFGGEEKGGSRVMNPDGSIAHVEVQIGDSAVMLFDRKDDWIPTPAFLRIYVENASDAFARAKEARATVVTEPTPLFFGEKAGRLLGPWSNLWWVHERLEELEWQEMEKRVRDPDAQKTMQYMQESLDQALRGAPLNSQILCHVGAGRTSRFTRINIAPTILRKKDRGFARKARQLATRYGVRPPSLTHIAQVCGSWTNKNLVNAKLRPGLA